MLRSFDILNENINLVLRLGNNESFPHVISIIFSWTRYLFIVKYWLFWVFMVDLLVKCLCKNILQCLLVGLIPICLSWGVFNVMQDFEVLLYSDMKKGSYNLNSRLSHELAISILRIKPFQFEPLSDFLFILQPIGIRLIALIFHNNVVI